MSANKSIKELDKKYNGYHLTDEKEYERTLDLLEFFRSLDNMPGVSVKGMRLTVNKTVEGFNIDDDIRKLKLQWADYQEAVVRQKELEDKQEELNKKMKKEEKRQENYGS